MTEQEKIPEKEQNGGKQPIRYRVQNNVYKDAQGTKGELQQRDSEHRKWT